MVAADFDAYAAAQRRVDARWQDRAAWDAAAIRNVAQCRLVLVRPHDPRICARDLGRDVKPPRGALAALIEGRHDDPFSLLGPFAGPAGTFARAWIPGAETARGA